MILRISFQIWVRRPGCWVTTQVDENGRHNQNPEITMRCNLAVQYFSSGSKCPVSLRAKYDFNHTSFNALCANVDLVIVACLSGTPAHCRLPRFV